MIFLISMEMGSWRKMSLLQDVWRIRSSLVFLTLEDSRNWHQERMMKRMKKKKKRTNECFL